MKKENSSLTDFLTKFFLELNQNDVQYAVLRNYKYLPYSSNGSDIDMWVYYKDTAKCINLLVSVSKASTLNLVSYYGDSTAIKVCLQNEATGVQFDIFLGAIYYKERILIPGDSIINNTISFNGILVVNDVFSNILALLKEIINNGNVKNKYIEPILSNKNDYSYNFLVQHFNNFDNSFLQKLCHSIEESSIDKDSKRLAQLCKASLSAKGKTNKTNILISKIKRLFWKKTGYHIVVEGTDGSGKSFIINSITPILNGGFHNGIVYNHLRPHYIPDIAELFGKRKKSTNKSKIIVSNPHAEKPSGFIGSIIRWSYYLIDYTWGYLKKVWIPIHSKSKVYIFDRYYYEFYLDQRRSRVNLPMWIIRIGEFFISKPDIILCLGGDPQKIYARKPETSLEEVVRQTKKLEEFCKNRYNAVWIDTTVTPEESIDSAMRAIIKMMSTRFTFNDIIK